MIAPLVLELDEEYQLTTKSLQVCFRAWRSGYIGFWDLVFLIEKIM